MTADRPDTPTSSRRRPLLLAAGAVAIVVVLVAAVVLVNRSDDSGDASDTTTTSAVSSDSDEEGSTTVPVAGPEAPSVPVETIAGGTAAAVCQGVLDRLDQYADAARSTTVPDAVLVENFADFTDEIFTLADGAEWGDQVIEELTTVSREWANAAAAASAGDDAGAQDAADAALSQLDATVADTTCPEG